MKSNEISSKRKKKGFTLIELIIVVAIIGLLASALFVAVDPAKRIGEARDAQRWSDVTAILNAILTYTVDNTTLPTDVSALASGQTYVIQVGSSLNAAAYGVCGNTAVENEYTTMQLKTDLVGVFLATMPVDPALNKTTVTTTGYYIVRSAANRIKVGSCNGTIYPTASISVQR